MLHYLCHSDYSNAAREDDSGNALCGILLDSGVLVLAGKYLIPSLQILASEKLTLSLKGDGWNLADLVDVIRSVYSISADATVVARQAIVRTVMARSKNLFTKDEYSGFQDATRKTPEFLFEFSCAAAVETLETLHGRPMR